MKRPLISRARYLVALWLAGTVALACATWICFRLGLNPAATSFVYLIIIVLLSLMDSFISSALFSVIAVACLNFFFVEPLYVFHVAAASDLAMLTAFLITSLVVTGLVRRIQARPDPRRAGPAPQSHARFGSHPRHERRDHVLEPGRRGPLWLEKRTRGRQDRASAVADGLSRAA